MLSLRERSPQPSHYVTPEYYDALIAWRDAASNLGAATDIGLNAECAALLHYEARLIDARRFAEWLDLLSEECVYWVPTDRLTDPRLAVNVAFDDRRRLEDRLIRLDTGYAHNQLPDRRMQHFISNVEAWEDADGKNRRVKANEQVFEHRTGKHLIHYIAQLDYWLTLVGDQWKIKVKRVMLIDSLDGLDTPTLL